MGKIDLINKKAAGPTIDKSGIRLSFADLDFIVGEFKRSAVEKNVPNDHSLFKGRFLYKDCLIVFYYTTGLEMPEERPVTNVLWIAFKPDDETKWVKMKQLPYARGCVARSETDRLGMKASPAYENEVCPPYKDNRKG